MKPGVAVVVLNYNDANSTIACVRSLLASTYPSLEIVVVDNGSRDNSETTLRDTLAGEQVEVLQTGKNLGFAGGNNAGFYHILSRNPKYVMFMNNDTIADPDFLEPVVDALETDARAAGAVGLICYYPEKDRVWYAGGDFNALRASSFTRSVDMPVSSLQTKGIQEVTFITGCMMLLRTEALERIGPFDDRFFMYVEDAELSARLVSAGYRLLYVPSSRIYHKVSHRDIAPVPLYYNVRNRLLLARLALQGWRAFMAMTYVVVSTTLKTFVWSFTNPQLAKAARWGIIDYSRKLFYQGRGPLLAPEGMAKQHEAYQSQVL